MDAVMYTRTIAHLWTYSRFELEKHRCIYVNTDVIENGEHYDKPADS